MMTLNDRKCFFLLWCVASSLFGNAQQVTGRVASRDGVPLPYSTIMAKAERSGGVILLYTSADIKGHFQIDIGKIESESKFDSLWLEVSHVGFENLSELVLVGGKLVVSVPWLIKLNLAASVKLREVEVQGRRSSFIAKKDTTVFRVDSYKEGMDRKIVDVIRRLPGVEIKDASGEIFYRGVAIETLTLDGDDLFGSNYVVGSKNINVDLVESIEAIENYSRNRVLRGLEEADKTVLNLKLKKDKNKVNVGLDAGVGRFSSDDISLNGNANALIVIPFVKSFGSVSYNNVGINNSPFDPLGGSITLDRQRDGTGGIHKVIADENISSPFTNGRDRINRQFFGTASLFYRMSAKSSLKANIHHASDRFNAIRVLQQSFLINNNAFVTVDEALMSMQPVQTKAEIEYRSELSKSMLLEVRSTVGSESFVQQSHTLQNGGLNVESLLRSRDLYGQQSITFSKRRSKRSAVQIALKASFGAAPQSFGLSPSQSGLLFGIDTQASKFRRQNYEAMAVLLQNRNKVRFKLSQGVNYDIVPYSSLLSNAVGTMSENELVFRRGTFFNNTSLNYEKGKWTIGGSASFKLMGQQLVSLATNGLPLEIVGIVEGNAHISYRPRKTVITGFTAHRSQNSLAEQFLFTSRVLSGSRTSVSNVPSLALQTTTRVGFSFRIDDLFRKLESDLAIDYSIRDGNFFGNFSINDRTSRIIYFFSNKPVKDLSAYWKFAKYLNFLKSTAKLHISWNRSEFQNIVNQSEWRLNRMNNYLGSIFLKSAFDGPVNIEHKIVVEFIRSGTMGKTVFSNRSLENRSRVVGRISRALVASAFVNHLRPDLSNKSNNFWFIDIDIRLKPTGKKWDIALVFTNLMNQKTFEMVRVTDLSTTVFTSNLRPLNAMALFSLSL